MITLEEQIREIIDKIESHYMCQGSANYDDKYTRSIVPKEKLVVNEYEPAEEDSFNEGFNDCRQQIINKIERSYL